MKVSKTVEQLYAEQSRLWDICEDLYQQAHAAEKKAKAATSKWQKALKVAQL